VPRLKKELLRQFSRAAKRIIEQIDALWLQGEAIIAAFELEHATAILLWAAPDIRPSEHSAKSRSSSPSWPQTSDGRWPPMRSPGPPPPPRSRPCPGILPPPPLLPSCGGGWSRSGGAIRYLKPGIYLPTAEEFASRKEREKDSYRASYLLFLNLFSWDTSYGLQTTIPSTRLKSLSLVAISRIRQRLIADR